MPIGIFVNDIRIFDEFSIWSFRDMTIPSMLAPRSLRRLRTRL